MPIWQHAKSSKKRRRNSVVRLRVFRALADMNSSAFFGIIWYSLMVAR